MAIEQVVAAKSNGDFYNIIPPNISGSGAGGNGGAVAKASNTSLLDGVEVSRYNAGVFGSAVIDNLDQDIAYKPLTAGTFAYNNQRPVAKKTTTTISGVLNKFLISGAAKPSLINSIHKIQVLDEGYTEGVRTRKLTSAIRAGKWNEYSGEFEAGYPQASTDTFSLDPTYKDVAANPTRQIPGRLTYKTSAPYKSGIDTSNNYAEKTG